MILFPRVLKNPFYQQVAENDKAFRTCNTWNVDLNDNKGKFKEEFRKNYQTVQQHRVAKSYYGTRKERRETFYNWRYIRKKEKEGYKNP